MAALILIMIAAAAAAADDPIETYLDKTSAGPRCKAPAGGDIMVCGRRDADRYRVPFVVPTPGDPKMRGVHEERAGLIAETSPCDRKGPFLVGCGAIGVTVSTKIGGGKVEYRPLAP
ncbi:hypothetical protein ACFSCW_14605 [Sphingomonas tabacisoli]|uniref:Uncharacterized protein n=1 Tax=Sphingomonas tabacisoli TaxID=2249466 RepID=A0ABW4I570_9SPHN